jgi:hypothetical protein
VGGHPRNSFAVVPRVAARRTGSLRPSFISFDTPWSTPSSYCTASLYQWTVDRRRRHRNRLSVKSLNQIPVKKFLKVNAIIRRTMLKMIVIIFDTLIVTNIN